MGNLMELVCEPSNLAYAFIKASRGKQAKKEVISFRAHLWDNLNEMGRTLFDGTYRFGQYHTFTIFDPKERLICAAPFRDRVAMHALMRICHPIFDNYQMPHSFASRIGRGTYAALERTIYLCKRFPCYAKLDVCHYFDTIHHNTLRKQLSSLFKDPVLLKLFDDLLSTFDVTSGRGLPIGNLTSQYFANHYLSVADHFAKEKLRVPAMVRYMDDVLLFATDYKALKSYIREYVSFVETILRLEMHQPIVNDTRLGIPFCGYIVRSSGLRLSQRSRHRYRMKMASLRRKYQNGDISLTEYGQRIQALRAFVGKAIAEHFIQSESEVAKIAIK